MSRCKSYLTSIEKFYRAQSLDLIMFGYISGLRKALPTMTLTEALTIFLDAFELSEEEYCYENARQTYYRLLNNLVAPIEKGFKPDDKTII